MNKPLGPIAADYGPEEAAMRAYCADGERRALALGNRGPIRFTAEGALHPGILEAYSRCGFYVFEGVFGPEELADIEADFLDIRTRLPARPGDPVDAEGRPALGYGHEGLNLVWGKPLSDPVGGTKAAHGRYPVKMFEPRPAADAPDKVVYLILGSLQFSEACLRAYGHPGLLAVAAAVNGEDFAPFNEGLWMKEPGLGASVAWHQDGWTHWDSPDHDEGSHGFNFMGQLYGCTPANGLWVVPRLAPDGPRSGHQGQGGGGGDRAAAGRRAAGVQAGRRRHNEPPGRPRLVRQPQRGLAGDGEHGLPSSTALGPGGDGRGCAQRAAAVYDAERIARRARLVGYAIDARRQRFPDETPFAYAPRGVESGQVWRWDEAARAEIKDSSNLLDLGI